MYMKKFASVYRALFTLLIIFGLSIAPVFADHTATITISPNITNCNELGNTFTITVKNNANSLDSIWTVDIYKSTGVTNFSCGDAPSGWYLADYSTTGLCRYTASDISSYIDPGEQLNFTFYAVMSLATECTRTFHVATLDNQTPTGQYQHNYPTVSVDCKQPKISKSITSGNYLGVCPPENQSPGDFCWMTHGTIRITVYDNDTCDLGIDYCEWNYTVDGEEGSSGIVQGNGEKEIEFNITFDEDSVHILNIICKDIAGNIITDIEEFKVDNTPPETNKTYGEPYFTDGTSEWITSSTPIYLNAVDGGDNCAIGAIKTYYRVEVVDEKSCWDPGTCCVPEHDPNEPNWTEYTTPFTINEESCHRIEYYSVDKLGNNESIKAQCVFVDNTPPLGTKEVGDPKKNCSSGEDCDYWVTQNTPITLTCTDQEPHPVGNEKVCYKVYVDENNNTPSYCSIFGGELNQEGYCCINSSTITLHFLEDSNHTLEFYCEDALGNRNEVDTEKFRVDTLPPIIDKTLSGPQVGNCPPQDENDKCWIKDWTYGNGTAIHIEAYDNDTLGCAVDQITCDWWYILDGSQIINETYMQGLIPPFNITFDDETEHELHVKCCDALGNCYEDVETFYVDSSGPNVTKEFIGPWYNDSGVEYIDTATLINLTAHDNPEGVCAVGNVTIYWKDFYFQDEDNWSYCYQACEGWQIQYPSNPLDPTVEGWHKYEGPFNDLNESCHVLEYYAVDALGNVGPIGINCFFVDKTPPYAIKDFEGIALDCADGEDCDYWINRNTIINLNCKNRGPHPSPLDKIQWRIWDDITGNWTEWKESPVVIGGNDVSIQFEEDSKHIIEYKCSDKVGKESRVYNLTLKVDSTPPIINKTMLGTKGKDWIGNCPPENESDVCYVKGGSGILVSVYDPDPTGKGCAVGNVSCYYEVWWNSTLVDNGTFTNSTKIIFNEDSAHEVIIYCEDALGNSIEDSQVFLVDKEPPTTIKSFGEPKLGNGTHLWITSSTPINLTATDDKVGVDYIKYRITYLGNKTCPEVCNYNGTGSWRRINGTFAQFTIKEDSCHLIEYYAVDKFGNNETIHKQCVMVDNTPPMPNKTVGEPKEIWDGKDAVFYDISDKCWSGGNDSLECWKVTIGTPITMSCIDPEPHPVNHARVCFAVGVDGVDKTEEYCNIYNGSYNERGDGFCCLNSTIENFTFLERTEHELEYYCVDALGNKGELDIEKFKVIGEPFKIKLNKKWNLISVPFVLLDNNITKVFKDISNDINSVWTYDAASDQWFVYRPGKENTSNLKEINPGWGYWVMAYNDTELIIGGDLYNPAVTPPGRELKKGWNLIGYYGLENETENYEGPIGKGRIAYCALYTLRNEESIYPPTKWSSLLTYWEPLDEEFIELGVCDRLDPGAGYWIYVDEDKGYARATVCPEWLVEEICGILSP